MAEKTVQNMSASASLTPTFSACSLAGDYVKNTGRIFLYFKNANVATPRTVTVHSQVLCNQGVEHDAVITVPASSEELAGFFSVNRFNDPEGKLQFTYSSEADLTVAAISVAD